MSRYLLEVEQLASLGHAELLEDAARRRLARAGGRRRRSPRASAASWLRAVAARIDERPRAGVDGSLAPAH